MWVRSSTLRRWFRSLLLPYLLFWPFVMGCERPPETSERWKRLPAGTVVAVIGRGTADPSWPGISGGARQYHERFPGVDCLALAPADESPESLVAVVEQACARKAAAICVCVGDQAAARRALEPVAGRGAVLVTIGGQVDGVLAYGSVEVGWPEGAELLGKSLDAIAGGKLSYVLLHERGKDDLASRCYYRFIAAADARSTLRMLTDCNAAEAGRSPQQLVQDMLQLYHHTGLIVTLTPAPWLPREPRLVLPEQNRFATLGAPPRLWPLLQAGEAAGLVGPLDGDVGYAAVEMAVRGIIGISGAPTCVVIPCELVTAKTLPDFARRYAAASGLALANLLPFEPATQPASRPGGD